MFNVYCHQNKVNGKRYIGVTSKSLEERAGRNAEGYRSTGAFYRAIQEYGWDNFSHEVLCTFENRGDAMRAEKAYIAKYGTNDPEFGYNQQKGGYPHTDESARANEVARIQGIRHTLHAQRSSAEVRAEMSERMHKVWDDPDRRAAIIASRSTKKRGGRPHFSVRLVETGDVFETAADLAKYLKCGKPMLWARLRKYPEFNITATPDGYSQPTVFTVQRLSRGV